jgi:hypothetical protein
MVPNLAQCVFTQPRSTTDIPRRPCHVCSYPKSGAKADILALRIRANTGSQRCHSIVRTASIRFGILQRQMRRSCWYGNAQQFEDTLAAVQTGPLPKASSSSRKGFLLKAIAARSWARQDPTVPTRPPVGAAGDRAKNPSQNGLSLPSAGKPRGTPLDASPARKPRPSLDVAHFGDHASPSIDLGA